MVCCSKILKPVTIAVALMAFLIAVGNPILNELIAPEETGEKEVPRNSSNNNNKPFDPSQTDVLNYTRINFVKEGEDAELVMGLTYILHQSFPRWVLKLLEKYGQKTQINYETVNHPIDLLDARKHLVEKEQNNNNEKSKKVTSLYNEYGFTLIDMKDDPSIRTVTNWRSPTDIKIFQDELEPYLKTLFPDATRIEYTYNVVRGGNKFGDQPAAINSMHLDYTQNDTARVLFHDEYGLHNFIREPNLLLGKENTDDEEMKTMIGIWKPINTKRGVCDHPLAVMDARTFQSDQEGLYPIHINFGAFTLHNLNGAIHHHPDQKWYYYPFQKESEVLVFTQYSRGRHFANPHGSFVNPNCPDDTEPRVSVEMRAAVFMKKEK